jgi:hypothetical protein
MLIFIWLLLGLVAGSLFVRYVHVHPARRKFILGLGLVVAALIYVVFALWSNALSLWLLIELAGVALYGTAGLLGMRGSIWWLAAGWALHPVWDVVLHSLGAGSVFAPQWYVFACVSFDLLVAGYVVYVNFLKQKITKE